MIGLIAICIALVFLYKAREKRIHTRDLKYRYQLFALRDDLRDKAVSGAINRHNLLFHFLDTTFTKTGESLSGINLYQLMAVHRYGNVDDLEKRYDRLFAELSKKENKDFILIIEQYVQIISMYLEEKHRGLFYAVNGSSHVGRTALFGYGQARALFLRVVEELLIRSDTSTFREFVSQSHALAGGGESWTE